MSGREASERIMLCEEGRDGMRGRYPFSERLVLDDVLRDGSKVREYGWGVAETAHGQGVFANGAYEITVVQNLLYLPTHNARFGDFTFEVGMRIRMGDVKSMGGVIFRHELGTGKNYMFLLGVDGVYRLVVNKGYGDAGGAETLKVGRVASFNDGVEQLHVMGVVAKGAQIEGYVYGKRVLKVKDATYVDGEIGMVGVRGGRRRWWRLRMRRCGSCEVF
jgi:hypothetical protein